MRIAIKRVDPKLPLPKYETSGSAGFDFVVREGAVIKAGDIALLPANTIVQIPEGYMLIIAARSSTPRRTGLVIPHGIGIIDSDYCGPEDEVCIQVWNPTSDDVEVKRGDRIAQGLIMCVERAEWQEVEEIVAPTRGGFGSTG